MTAKAHRLPGMLANVVASEAGWFACVLSAAAGQPLWGLLAAILIISGHLWLSRPRWPEIKLLMIVVVTGGTWDSLVVASGLMHYPSGRWIPGLAPYWIFALWGLFAIMLNRSMRWLRGRPVVAALLGGIGGPLSFMGGARLGAASFGDPILTPLVLGLGWAVLLPLMIRIAQHCEESAQ